MRQIVLLRGINIGPRNRIAMPRLREVLRDAGFADVATYVQSGNVLLTSDAPSARLAAECRVGREVDALLEATGPRAPAVGRHGNRL